MVRSPSGRDGEGPLIPPRHRNDIFPNPVKPAPLILAFITALLLAPLTALHAAETLFVENGEPRAEIVLAEKPPRMVTLAAVELRHFVEKMSGARLPIVTKPTARARVKIHIGRSAATERLGVTDDGLRDGAYRIVSGTDWLVLIGKDVDFDVSKLPWPMKRNDAARATDAAWGFPFASGFKGYWKPGDFDAVMTGKYGEDFAALWKASEGGQPGFWNQDESGSMNAVYGLLRGFGVRWFMAGELGEVVMAHHEDTIGEVEIARHDGNAEAVKATEATETKEAAVPDGKPVTQSVPEPEPELFFKPGEEAVPWALALHLEERIKSLGVKTAEVNRELDTLEAASAKLKKRMAL